MAGCESRAAARASFWNWPRASGSASSLGERILMATTRSRESCLASHTVEVPPAPRRWTIS